MLSVPTLIVPPLIVPALVLLPVSTGVPPLPPAPTWSVPLLMVVVPPYVLLPLRIIMPDPASFSASLPLDTVGVPPFPWEMPRSSVPPEKD
jgi:hypothetical protein